MQTQVMVTKKECRRKNPPILHKRRIGRPSATLTEKWTTPPKYYTEATLLRAMETAGKFVEDEELRAALKENGIGRPSSVPASSRPSSSATTSVASARI
mgnify:CR=1 FL=1